MGSTGKRLKGYRQDLDGHSLQLYEKNGEFSVKYKDEMKEIRIDYRVMPTGTYNQETTEIPYIVLDNNVYSLDSFTEMGRNYG